MSIHTKLPFLGIHSTAQINQTLVENFAQKCGLPLLASIAQGDGIWIDVSDTQCILHMKEGLAHTDYCSGFRESPIEYRKNTTSIHQEPLAEAVGLKHGHNLRVVDATAGWGRDSFILASLGASMVAVEQSLVLGFILMYNIHICNQNIDHKHVSIECYVQNSSEWLSALPHSDRPEVIYLDPMFPHKKKTSLAIKEMQILQLLLGNGDEEESASLLKTALTKATKRVVVKRPARAPYLGDIKPSFSKLGKSTRFDVYVI